MSDIVAENKVVLFNYTLRDSDGNEIDSSDGDPMPYLHGAQNIVPGLEKEMTGKKVGDSFEVVVSPADGYGEVSGAPPQKVERDAFPDGVEEGMPFMLETPDGGVVTIWVTSVTDSHIEFTTDHPLAGEELHFAIQITGIRDATADEIDHGHPHGPDGHSHHH